MELEEVNSRIDGLFIRLKLLGFKSTSFDLKNGYLSGMKFHNDKERFFFVQVPFKTTYIYPCVLRGHSINFIPLFSNNFPTTLAFDNELAKLLELPILPKKQMTKYVERIDRAFELMKDTIYGTTNNI